MPERHGLGLRKKIGRLVATSVLLPAASVNLGSGQSVDIFPDHFSIFQSTAAHRFIDSLPSVAESQDTGFFDQLDNYLETNYGRALAFAAVVGSLALLWSARKINSETDTETQEKLANFSSLVAISFASVLLAESFTDVNAKVPASLFEAFVVTQTALNFWRVTQRHRELGKRLPSLLISLSLMTISSASLAET